VCEKEEKARNKAQRARAAQKEKDEQEEAERKRIQADVANGRTFNFDEPGEDDAPTAVCAPKITQQPQEDGGRNDAAAAGAEIQEVPESKSASKNDKSESKKRSRTKSLKEVAVIGQQNAATTTAVGVLTGREMDQNEAAIVESQCQVNESAEGAAHASPSELNVHVAKDGCKTKWTHQNRMLLYGWVARNNPFKAARGKTTAAWETIAEECRKVTNHAGDQARGHQCA
jgi:hypothetical protein